MYKQNKPRIVRIGDVRIGRGQPLVLVAGPCVIESRKACMATAERLVEFAAADGAPLIFKASYDKANRSSHKSFRGLGIERGLDVLSEVKEKFGVPVLTDVHNVGDVARVARVADVLQVPAFLCRQTDLLAAMGRSGKAVNVKKGQFLAPWDMRNAVAKLESTGNRRIILTERGTSFGYNNLVADMRSLPILRGLGCPVIFDATHSVQLPGGQGDRSGGESRWIPFLARAAVAAGCDGIFAETHACPGKARCDADNLIPIPELKKLWRVLVEIDKLVGRRNDSFLL